MDLEMKRIYKNFDEHPNPVKLETTGTIPEWLHGVFLRVGPAYYDLESGFSVNHWFDGFAMLQNFVIKNGEVAYRSKFLQSDAYKKALEHQRTVYTEFGTRGYPDPCKNIFSRFFSHFVIPDITDNDMVNVFKAQDAVFAATEGHLIHRIDPLSLKTGERIDLNKVVNVNLATAHPHHESDGTTFNLGTSFVGIEYHVVKFPPAGKQRTSTEGKKKRHRRKDDERGLLSDGSILCRVPFSWNTFFSYYHSFSITENYIIFLEQPLLINTIKLMTAPLQGRSLTECFEWRPEENTRFYIVDKTTGEISKTKYYSGPFFFFHTINAYEEDNHIVIDIITYPTSQILDDLYLKVVRAQIGFARTPPPQPHRYVIPLASNVMEVEQGINLVTLPDVSASAERLEDNRIFLTPEVLGASGIDLPQINYQQYSAKKYRYFYATGLNYSGDFQNSVVKMDVQTKETKLWKGCSHCILGEPVFVPHPDAKDEDDGIVMAIVLELTDDHDDFLIFLDGKTMTEIARSVLKTSQMPPLLHGTYFNVPVSTLLEEEEKEADEEEKLIISEESLIADDDQLLSA